MALTAGFRRPSGARAIRAGAACSAALGAAWCAPALAPVAPPVSAALRLARRVPLAGAVALTFDDGPHPRGTPAVLEELREHAARATFFVVGEQVRRTGSLLAEIAAAGNAIGVHGDRHRNLLRLAPRALARDLDRAAATIGPLAGGLHRAPYGIYSPAALRAVRRRGWTPLLWSAWGCDWRAHATAASIAARATRAVRGGDVVLLHDADHYSAPQSWRATAAALPRILDELGGRGLRAVAV